MTHESSASKPFQTDDVRAPKRAARAGRGKSDEIAVARTVLASELDRLTTPRSDGPRFALRVLLVARQAIDSRRTAGRKALTALLRSFDLGMDVRKPLTDTQVKEVAGWRQRAADDSATATIQTARGGQDHTGDPRSLKRYIARQLFRQISAVMA